MLNLKLTTFVLSTILIGQIEMMFIMPTDKKVNFLSDNKLDNNSNNENINFNPTTIIMVTHNPELECYADRILYVQDGIFEKQVINDYQIALTVEEYVDFINNNIQFTYQSYLFDHHRHRRRHRSSIV